MYIYNIQTYTIYKTARKNGARAYLHYHLLIQSQILATMGTLLLYCNAPQQKIRLAFSQATYRWGTFGVKGQSPRKNTCDRMASEPRRPIHGFSSETGFTLSLGGQIHAKCITPGRRIFFFETGR